MDEDSLSKYPEYPAFFEALPHQGAIVHGLIFLLFAAFALGIHRLWRTRVLTAGSMALVCLPTYIGCALAALHSLIGETFAELMSWPSTVSVYIRGPERYIGNLWIYLAVGIVMSIVLLAIAHISLRRHRGENAESTIA